MSSCLNDCVLVQYADDTQFLHTGTVNNLENLIVKTEETLIKANHYFLRNGLMINPNKTQCIFIGNRQLLSRIPKKTTIKFAGNTITSSNHVKNLGLYIDRYTTFDVHINESNKKVIGTLMYINRLSDNFQKPTRVINHCIISCAKHY